MKVARCLGGLRRKGRLGSRVENLNLEGPNSQLSIHLLLNFLDLHLLHDRGIGFKRVVVRVSL